MKRYAEEANYWNTTVHPAKSKGEIEQMLDDFGATQQMTAKGKAGYKIAWMIRFLWNEHSYRFIFTPLDCMNPDRVSTFGGKRRTHVEQSEYQMGRIATHFVKAILTAAEAYPHSLFGFMELPQSIDEATGIPRIAGEINVKEIQSAMTEFLLPETIAEPGGNFTIDLSEG